MLHMRQTAETNNPTDSFLRLSPRGHVAGRRSVQRRAKGVTTQIIDVTPALAEVLLERNPSNRKIRQALVDAFSRDMENREMGVQRRADHPLG